MSKLKKLLDAKVQFYNCKDFIEKDPISIPHAYSSLQDIEITAFFAAILAWGNRTTIINSCKKLFTLMDNAPYQFIHNHQPKDLKPFLTFVHRTFNATDLLYTIQFLQHHYQHNHSLQTAFSQFNTHHSSSTEAMLIGFHNYFFSLPHAPERTRKHIATPAKKSACKRLNMFLRWMVRKDGIVDFGLWEEIRTAQLVCPLDTHSGNVARRLGLLTTKQNNWEAAVELTNQLKSFNSEDPTIYDFALFGIGAEERMAKL